MQKYFNNVTTPAGVSVPFATVTVRTHGGGLATVYSDNGVTLSNNPITADSLGVFSFYAADGRYDLSISGAGISTQTVTDILLEDPVDGLAALSASTGSGLVGFLSSAASALATTVYAWLNNWATVKNFVTGDGVADDTAGLTAAVAHAYSTSKPLYWNGEICKTTATIPNFHLVSHVGLGSVKRGTDVFYVNPHNSQANTIYIGTAGDASNDGLSSSQPMATFQNAFDALANYGPVLDGVWTVQAAGNTFTISAGSHNHMTPSRNRVGIKGPAAGHPNVPTCIVDGGGVGTAYFHGINCDGIGVRVQVQDIKFQNFKVASGNTRVGLLGANGADLYTVNVHGLDCSWSAIMAKECEQVRISGGILDCGTTGAYGFVSDSSHSSFGYGATNLATGPQVKNALSSGVYWSTGSQGHNDWTSFSDCAVAFLCAENSRADTVGNDYKRNVVAKRAITGGLFASGGAAETFNDGTADANTTDFEYKAYSGDLSELDDQGSGSWQRVAFDRTTHALSGVTPTTLATPYTIAAQRMAGIGKACRVHALGVFTQATAGSTMTVTFGGMSFTVTVPAAASNVAFEIDVTLYEIAGGYRAIGKLAQGLNAVRFGSATAGFDKTTSQAITIAATLANAGDSMNLYRTDVYLMG